MKKFLCLLLCFCMMTTLFPALAQEQVPEDFPQVEIPAEAPQEAPGEDAPQAEAPASPEEEEAPATPSEEPAELPQEEIPAQPQVIELSLMDTKAFSPVLTVGESVLPNYPDYSGYFAGEDGAQEFKSLTPDIVTVDEKGVLTAVAAGEGAIDLRLTSAATTVLAHFAVTVQAAPALEVPSGEEEKLPPETDETLVDDNTVEYEEYDPKLPAICLPVGETLRPDYPDFSAYAGDSVTQDDFIITYDCASKLLKIAADGTLCLVDDPAVKPTLSFSLLIFYTPRAPGKGHALKIRMPVVVYAPITFLTTSCAEITMGVGEYVAFYVRQDLNSIRQLKITGLDENVISLTKTEDTEYGKFNSWHVAVTGKAEGEMTLTFHANENFSVPVYITVRKAPTQLSITQPLSTFVGEKISMGLDFGQGVQFNRPSITTDWNGMSTGYEVGGYYSYTSGEKNSLDFTPQKSGLYSTEIKTFNELTTKGRIFVYDNVDEVILTQTELTLPLKNIATRIVLKDQNGATVYAPLSVTEGQDVVSADFSTITPKKQGTAVVTVTSATGKTAQINVTVVEVPTTMTLNHTQLTLNALETADILPVFDKGYSNVTYTFYDEKGTASDKQPVAKIDDKGHLIALAPGTVTVSVSAAGIGLSALCKVTVADDDNTLTFSHPAPKGFGVGHSFQLAVTDKTGKAYPAVYTRKDSKYDPCAKIDENNVLYGVRVGTLEITAQLEDGRSISYTQHVANVPSEIHCAPIVVPVNSAQELIITSDLDTYIDVEVEFVDKTIATYNAGFIRPLKIGKTQIKVTAVYGGATTMVDLEVTEPDDQVYIENGNNMIDVLDGYPETLPRLVDYYGNVVKCTYAITYQSSSLPQFYKNPFKIVNGNKISTNWGDANAIVTATAANGKSATISVFAHFPPDKVYFYSDKVLLTAGETDYLSLGWEGNNPALISVEYTVSNPDVVSIEQKSMSQLFITAHALGTAVIKAKTRSGKTATCTVTVAKRPDSISISVPDSVTTVTGGEQIQLQAIIEPADADQSVKWSCVPESYRWSITQKGLFSVDETLIEPVTVLIYAESGLGGTARYTMNLVPRQHLVITTPSQPQSGYTLDVRYNPFQMVATMVPSGDTPAVKWSVSDEKLATISETGELVVKDSGRLTVTATAVVDGKKYSATTAVQTSKNLQKLVLTGPEEVFAGTSFRAEITAYPEQKLKFISSSPACSISSNGMITTRSVDKRTKVTIYGDRANSLGEPNLECYTFTIIPVCKEIQFYKYGYRITTLRLGVDDEPFQLYTKALPEDALQTLTFKSSDPTVVSVDENGLLTPHKMGKATIYALANDGTNKKASMSVTVGTVAKSVVITGSHSVAAGKTISLSSEVFPKEASQRVTWLSSDDSVCTVSSNGKVTAKKNIRAGRTITITATSAERVSVCARYEITVLPCVTSVSILKDGLSQSSLSMDVSDAPVALSAVLLPENAGQAVQWRSSSSKIVSVDENGVITPLKKGSATITATAMDGSGKKDSIRVTIAALAKNVTITGSDQIAAGKSLTLKAIVSPSDASTALSWKSSDPTVCTISSSGKLTARKINAIQTVTVTATTTDGTALVATHQITVMPAVGAITILSNGQPVTSLSMDVSTAPVTLSTRIAPADASERIAWSSSSTKTVTVDEHGVLTPVKKGSATITATAMDGSGKKATLRVSVVALAKEIKISGSHAIAAGKSVTFVAGIAPADAGKRVSWKSSDTSVLTVSSSGKVSANKNAVGRSATITATCLDGTQLTASYEVAVTAPATSVSVEKDGAPLRELVLKVGASAQLSASVLPQNAAQGIVWKSNSSAVTVSASGLVTAQKVGSARITAAAADGTGKSVSVNVIVRVLIEKITLTGADTLFSGKSTKLSAAIAPAKPTMNRVKWSSSNTAVASVSSKGVVSAKTVTAPTRVTITVQAMDGSGVSATFEIVVLPKIYVQ